VVTCWYSDHANLIFRMPTGLPCSHILWYWIFGITNLISSIIAPLHPCSSLRSSGTIEFHVQMADFRRGVRNNGSGRAAGPPSFFFIFFSFLLTCFISFQLYSTAYIDQTAHIKQVSFFGGETSKTPLYHFIFHHNP